MRPRNGNVIFMSPAAAELDLRGRAAEKAETDWNRALSSKEITDGSNVVFIHGGEVYENVRRAREGALDRALFDPVSHRRNAWYGVAESHDVVLRGLRDPGYAHAVSLETEATSRITELEARGLPHLTGPHREDVSTGREIRSRMERR